ncbi:VOC family protein [Sphingomonas sp. AX6]|uniref:VOC family protein n=1 Tax=Sphingomonas sp. AX6 TaxID=2653171 RepID=UPI0012EF288D|nr:VOC family protein [Sphingomonas sp. AX6]VXC78063.1 Glyoxalase [Sphingomonas sp. AX6]
MTNKHGEWVWFEFITTDPEAAQSFYADVVGWSAKSSGTPDMDYRLLSADDGEVAGLMKQPDGMGDGPAWLGYIGVDDVDASVKAIEEAGGTTHMPATTLPGIGRMAMLTDPQGVAFYVMRGKSDQPSTAFKQSGEGSVGHVVWCELSAPDPDKALEFYQNAFHWGQEGGMPMGELGDYRFLQAGDVGFGALMGVMPGGAPGWQFYFHVPDIDAGADAIRSGGGTIIQEPMEIPGGDHALVARDPQGAGFGLVGPRK